MRQSRRSTPAPRRRPTSYQPRSTTSATTAIAPSTSGTRPPPAEARQLDAAEVDQRGERGDDGDQTQDRVERPERCQIHRGLRSLAPAKRGLAPLAPGLVALGLVLGELEGRKAVEIHE